MGSVSVVTGNIAPNDLEAVALGEVLEAVMGGDQQPVLFGQHSNLLGDPSVQVVKLACVRGCVVTIESLTRRGLRWKARLQCC